MGFGTYPTCKRRCKRVGQMQLQEAPKEGKIQIQEARGKSRPGCSQAAAQPRRQPRDDCTSYRERDHWRLLYPTNHNGVKLRPIARTRSEATTSVMAFLFSGLDSQMMSYQHGVAIRPQRIFDVFAFLFRSSYIDISPL